MPTPSAAPRRPQSAKAQARAIPAEIVNVGATAGALLAATAVGAVIAQVLPLAASPWSTAAAYGGPAAVAGAAYWWFAQRI